MRDARAATENENLHAIQNVENNVPNIFMKNENNSNTFVTVKLLDVCFFEILHFSLAHEMINFNLLIFL